MAVGGNKLLFVITSRMQSYGAINLVFKKIERPTYFEDKSNVENNKRECICFRTIISITTSKYLSAYLTAVPISLYK